MDILLSRVAYDAAGSDLAAFAGPKISHRLSDAGRQAVFVFGLPEP
jgi:hypothetical protein